MAKIYHANEGGYRQGKSTHIRGHSIVTFGIGVNYRRDDPDSVNNMVGQILSALNTHKAVTQAIKQWIEQLPQ